MPRRKNVRQAEWCDEVFVFERFLGRSDARRRIMSVVTSAFVDIARLDHVRDVLVEWSAHWTQAERRAAYASRGTLGSACPSNDCEDDGGASRVFASRP